MKRRVLRPWLRVACEADHARCARGEPCVTGTEVSDCASPGSMDHGPARAGQGTKGNGVACAEGARPRRRGLGVRLSFTSGIEGLGRKLVPGGCDHPIYTRHLPRGRESTFGTPAARNRRAGVRRLWPVAALALAVACNPVTPGPKDVTTLRVALWAGGNELEIERRVVERYESLNPGVRVVLESAPNGYEERLLTSIAAGRPPDVYLLDSPDIPTFADRGLTLDLAPYRSALGFRDEEIFSGVLDAFVRGESLVALPKDFTPMVFYANLDVLERSGIEPPPLDGWTWDDFRRVAHAVSVDEDGDGRRDVHAFDFPRNLYQWIPFVWSAGGDILGSGSPGVGDGRSGSGGLGRGVGLRGASSSGAVGGEPPPESSPDGSSAPEDLRASGFMDGPEALAAFTFLTEMAEEGLTPGAQFVQQGDPAREARFASGRQAFLLSGHWTLPVFRDLVGADGLALAVFPIPHHPSQPAATTVLYASGWAVAPNGPNPRRAVALAGFLASAEAQRIRARSGLAIPSRRAVAREIAASDPTGIERAFLALAEGGRMTWGATVRDFAQIEVLATEIMDRRLLNGEALALSAGEVARRTDELLVQRTRGR